MDFEKLINMLRIPGKYIGLRGDGTLYITCEELNFTVTATPVVNGGYHIHKGDQIHPLYAKDVSEAHLMLSREFKQVCQELGYTVLTCRQELLVKTIYSLHNCAVHADTPEDAVILAVDTLRKARKIARKIQPYYYNDPPNKMLNRINYIIEMILWFLDHLERISQTKVTFPGEDGERCLYSLATVLQIIELLETQLIQAVQLIYV